jgi:Coenzyme PQQ synthesis protein D (PqqD)
MKPELSVTPRLAPGVHMNDRNQQPRQLLTPKGPLRLSGPSLEIVRLCDGKHTVQQIIEQLQALYSKAEPDRVTNDVLNYLDLLHGQAAIEF